MSVISAIAISILSIIVVLLTAGIVVLWYKYEYKKKMCIGLHLERSNNKDVDKVINIMNSITNELIRSEVCSNKKELLDAIANFSFNDKICEKIDPDPEIKAVLRYFVELQHIACDGGKTDVDRVKHLLTDFVTALCPER